jgi:hypothetical protein
MIVFPADEKPAVAGPLSSDSMAQQGVRQAMNRLVEKMSKVPGGQVDLDS